MAKLTDITIHCTDSPWGCVREVRRWHMEKGWRDIGYHFLIMNGRPVPSLYLKELDGMIEIGRDLDGDTFIEDNEVGAHALGYNRKSIGIVLVGTDMFTDSQMQALVRLIRALRRHFNLRFENTRGHYEIEQAHGKTCPNFNVANLREILKYIEYEETGYVD